MQLPDPRQFEFNLTALEERIRRMDRKRKLVALACAFLLHASLGLTFIHWTPEPIEPPGEMMITVDLAPAVASTTTNPSAGQTTESAAQVPTPPEPEPLPEKKKEIVEEQPLPEPEIAKDDLAEPPPPAEKAEVVIAPKKKQETSKEKPKPQPPAPQQAASSVSEQRADVGGSGARASPSDIARYVGLVRAAIERNKRYPSSAGGAQGSARIGFTVTRSGGISDVRLTKSSGNAALDAAAMNAVASASVPPVPEGLPGSMNLGAPISFRMRPR